ncbi:MAG: HEAT repeat domain-containing protein [Oscillatoriales cyanobacterium RM2_1_1]|nr:HEAT repeat domain-containing protein [Oscillatoriales cyanobacterium SM2_3_0]NJO45759.1 HEAT repeat domain-containing protein [Oscillatoriales cyanobacterium RM2_1_1]
MTVTPETIEQWLDSEDLGDRLRAVNQMRTLDPTIAFGLIQKAVADANARVRYAAVSQLSTLGTQDLPLTLEILRDRMQNDSEADVQAAAADAVGALHLQEAYPDLQTLYTRTPEWLVKMSIVAALGELGASQGFDLLADALNQENELIQTVAIGALGELQDERAVPLLIPYISSPDWQVRHRVAQALAKFGRADVHQALQQLATDEVEPVAEAARAGLNDLV